MTKLEELKVLEKEKDKWRLEWINAQKANDDDEVIRSYELEYKRAKRAWCLIKDELLPHLIAVSEAAKKIKMFDYSDNDEDFVWMLDNITAKLEPLTKDTDK